MEPDQRPIIMAVDDDPVLLNLTVGMLRKDYRLRPFTSGRMAFKYLALPGSRADLALLDYQMPDMDGPELWRRLKAESATRDIPVVFMTGLEDADSASTLLAEGAAAFISKPPRPAELLATLRSILPGQSAEAR